MAKKADSENGSLTGKRRLTIVFDGKYQPLFDRIQQIAEAEDRDPDTVVLRCLNDNLTVPAV